ncbi:MAG: DUF1572 family protein [Anaerolineae bacterium]|nr:DUF1572 family protein [Anaerolineae bacterium]
MADSLASIYLDDVIRRFRYLKSLADRAMAQIDDRAFFAVPDDESNSIAIIVKHIAGNMRSRWQDFLISDGEKPDRHRDAEFVIETQGREELVARWEAGWRYLFEAVEALDEADLTKEVSIRGEQHVVIRAINRQLSHYAYHVGQVVFLARHFRGGDWQSLSVPRGQSEAFNEAMRQRRTDCAHGNF